MSVPSILSERHQGRLFLGKKPAQPLNDRHVKWSELRALPAVAAALPPIPAIEGHGNDFAYWGMLANGPCDDNTIDQSWAAYEGCGDCWPAGQSHSLMESAHDAGSPPLKFSCLSTANQYAAFTEKMAPPGYDPETGANDNGSDPQQGLEWEQEVGITDASGVVHKTGPTVAADPGNLDHLWEITYLLECAGVGVNLQQAQENQFNTDPIIWDYEASSPIIGGHWIICVGHPSALRLRVVSWGLAIQATTSFYTNLNDETYGWSDLERINKITGKTCNHWSEVDIEEWITLLAQQKAAT